MALRRHLAVAALVLAATACKDKDKAATPSADFDKRCERLGKVCGDQDKHIQKVTDECKQAAKTQASCITEVAAVYSCYEKELCGGKEKVWALDDLRVLADRHGKCVAERDVSRACTEKK
jgi:hypothetical protein